MEPNRLIFLAIVGGATFFSRVSSAETPTSAVRALRTESNAAIAAHDVGRLRGVLDDDCHGINGTSGALDSGGEATARNYGEEEFRDPAFVTYRPTPESIVAAQSEKRIVTHPIRCGAARADWVIRHVRAGYLSQPRSI